MIDVAALDRRRGIEDSAYAELLERAFYAATIGPLRRPQGRATQKVLPAANGVVLLAQNDLGDKILFVQVIAVTPGGQATTFSRDGGAGMPMSIPIGSAAFILFPGEQLYGATNPTLVVDVFTTPF